VRSILVISCLLSAWSSSWVLRTLGADVGIFSDGEARVERFIAHAVLRVGALSGWHWILRGFLALAESRSRPDAFDDVYGSVVGQMMVERSCVGARTSDKFDGIR
jgi:hypothetical protein